MQMHSCLVPYIISICNKIGFLTGLLPVCIKAPLTRHILHTKNNVIHAWFCSSSSYGCNLHPLGALPMGTIVHNIEKIHGREGACIGPEESVCKSSEKSGIK